MALMRHSQALGPDRALTPVSAPVQPLEQPPAHRCSRACRSTTASTRPAAFRVSR